MIDSQVIPEKQSQKPGDKEDGYESYSTNSPLDLSSQ